MQNHANAQYTLSCSGLAGCSGPKSERPVKRLVQKPKALGHIFPTATRRFSPSVVLVYHDVFAGMVEPEHRIHDVSCLCFLHSFVFAARMLVFAVTARVPQSRATGSRGFASAA